MSHELRAEVDDAMSAVAGRHRAEQLRAANDATMQRLQQQGYAIAPHDVISLHLAVLLDTVLGDMDDPRRQAYEIAVHTRMAELFAEVGAAVARAKLLDGVQQNSIKLQRPGGQQ